MLNANDPQALFQSIKAEYQRGELIRGRQDAERGYRQLQNQPESQWYWKFKLLYAEMLLWNGDTNKANKLLSEAPPAKYAESCARYQMLQGYILFRTEKNCDAEKLLDGVASRAETTGEYELAADTELLLARFLSDLSADRAQAASLKALSVADAHGLNYQKAAAFLDLGLIQVKRAHYGDAIPYFQKVREIAGSTGARVLNDFAEDNLAECYYNIGDLEPALKIELEVLKVSERVPNLKPALANRYFQAGNLYLLLQDFPRATRCFRQALALVNESDSPETYASMAASLAQALEKSGALDEAEYYNRKAIKLSDKEDRNGLGLLTLNEAAIAQHRGNAEQAISSYRKAIELGTASPSLLWQAYAGLGSTFATCGDVANAKVSFEHALRVIEQNRSEQSLTEYKITFLSALIHFYQEYVALLMSRNEIEKALEVADSSRASVLTEDVTRTTAADHKHLVSDVQKAARRADTVFVFYWLAPSQSYMWVLTPQELKAIGLPGERQITQDVQSYRYAIEEEKQDPLASSNAAGKRLYQTLIAPAAAWIRPGTKVVIVPDGSLHNLNFETLLADQPVLHYWLEDVTILIEPSLNILETKTAAQTKAPESLLLLGDPETAGTGFQKLPQASMEMEQVRRHFPANHSVVYSGVDASPDTYRAAQPQRFSTIHFATHAEANEQRPLDSAIILSPRQNGYKLYARDAMETPLQADLVTISACRGAGARTLSGEGLVGFAWAFFQAGARNVVSSLWDVNDRSTADLMDRFYGGIEAGNSYGEALRRAKLAMLQSNYRKPYYWAPFQLYSRLGGAS
ncbi:MAG: CHAT domain-containing protein [Acidobacteriaceae bacterium]|nr:CHAT domain-containing protein [Acidobacteriaceae bacterium]